MQNMNRGNAVTESAWVYGSIEESHKSSLQNELPININSQCDWLDVCNKLVNEREPLTVSGTS